jgi:hypothetical protein
MKPQQLISAGFAITALAAASVPAVGWTLLGGVDQPPITTSVQAPWDAVPLGMAHSSIAPFAPVAVERAHATDSSSIPATPW